ncbi:hypothetical protein DPMN_194959 [Dreissena polymorpha]|uniref:Uncharacterized protein n=1 Tax=Dreissena polymorpha TaxID=45954 RepID=A0A9D3Y562_DREPO|nr:hypothetical protein DPMN_194959 [Dreissena polymorpha]
MTICEIVIFRQTDCPLGSYSINCSKQCHCRVGSCDSVTGACWNGTCEDGWSGMACNEIADVEFTASQNEVKFVNIDGHQNISINVQLADNQTVAYIRLYINDTTENQATIIFGRPHVEVMLCNSENCTHNNRTTGPTNQLPQIRMILKNAYELVIQDLFQWPNSTRTIFNESGYFYFTNLALSSITGKAIFKIVPQQGIVKHFENNSKKQIEFTHVMFPPTTPLIDQPKGSPPKTAPLEEYPGLTPVVPKYRNSLAKSMHRSHDARSKRSTSSSGGSNSSFEDECLTDCYCPCSWVVEPKNYTQNEIANKVAAIQQRLKVDMNKLASTQRKLNCVPDNRSSAKAVGLVGMIFLVLILAVIFVFDIGNIICDLKTLNNNPDRDLDVRKLHLNHLELHLHMMQLNSLLLCRFQKFHLQNSFAL